MVFDSVQDAAHAFGTLAVQLVKEFPLATLLLVTVLATVPIYRLLHPTLIPGDPHSVLFLFSDASYPQPYASTLSPFSLVWARLDWCIHAFKRGTTPRGLARQVKKDYQIDWFNGQRPEKGDLISAWDRVFEWNDDCIEMTTLESMRNLSDPLSDRVLDSFAVENELLQPSAHRPPTDVMERIAQHALLAADEKHADDDVQRFWNAIDRRPPPGAGAVSLDWYEKHGLLSTAEIKASQHCRLDRAFINEPNWTPEAEDAFEASLTPDKIRLIEQEEARVLQRGRDVFHKYGPNMNLGLLLVGLAGGFASPRITNVLKATGYLVQPRTKKSKGLDEVDTMLLQRLNEYVEKSRLSIKGSGSPTASPPSTTQLPNFPSDASSERTFRRLLETETFVLDLMETEDSLAVPSQNARGSSRAPLSAQDLLDKGGKGWLACSRVRFLHTNVRRRLRKRTPTDDASIDDTVINQEDLLATLCAFTVAPLWALQRMGQRVSYEERRDLIAFWRHVGFYMGVEPRFLRRNFRDIAAAERTFCCISSHHFLPFAGISDASTPAPPSISLAFGPAWARKLREEEKAQGGSNTSSSLSSANQFASHFDFDKGPALPLLWTMAERPPGNMAFSILCSVARFVLGPGLANATSLPATTTSQYFAMRLRLLVLGYPVLFGHFYPRKAWAHDLRENWVVLLRRIVVWSSKMQRTSFATSKDGSHDDTYSAYKLDEQQGKRIAQNYRRLMAEMLVVTAFFGLAVLAGVLYMYLLAADALRNL